MLFLVGVALAGWPDAMAIGDCATVTAALPAPATPVERLAATRCLQRLGQSGRALEILGEPVDAGDLAPYLALVRARALLDRDQAGPAADALAGVSLPGTEEELLRGRALVQSGRGLEARDGLRALLEGASGDEARWWLAWAAEQRGDTAAAIGTYQALWTKAPTSTWAAKAAERLRALGSGAPDYETPEGRELAMARARRLIELKQAGMAVELLDGIHAKAPFTSAETQLWFARTLFDARLHARAVDWYGRAKAEEASAAAAFSQALATARSGDYETAAARYAALAKRWPDSAQADEALYKVPYMDYDAGRFGEAADGFKVYLAFRSSGKFAADARWFRAWGAWRAGDRAGAIAGFDEVIRLHGTTDLAVAARYWKARAADDVVALRELVRKHPTSGYAWFAAERLEIRYPVQSDAVAPAFPDSFLAARPGLATGLALLDAGLVEWARPLLAPHVDAARGGGKTTALAMAWALLRAEDYHRARSLALPWCGDDPVATQVCTPKPHGGAVETIARDHGLSPLLPYAIMNAESGLDPLATSPAGARGLMQLMPALAAELAAERIPGFGVDDLYLAGVNARLGTVELSLLHGRFGRAATRPSMPLVIAGYNGGAEAVERWLGGYTTPPEGDRFSEDISYTETRRYVRRVLGFLMDYRRVYGDR